MALKDRIFKVTGTLAIFGFLGIILSVLLVFNVVTLFQIKNTPQNTITGMSVMGQPMSRMSFSEFDAEQAREFMDKDNDGFCDACGMPIEQCIASGMMQCSMDKNAKIGLLGSQHIHADWKIYLNGRVFDLSQYSHMQRMKEGKSVSSFIHVDSGAPVPEKTGDIIHMHATGVPLSMFFESLDTKFSQNMNAYVNGKQINNYKDYVFNDLDKILVTDGVGDFNKQLNSITNFAGVH